MSEIDGRKQVYRPATYAVRPGLGGPTAMTEKRPDALIGEGPVPLSSDSWSFDPDEDLPNEPYRGVRRADSPRRWLRVVIGLVIVVMTAAGVAWLCEARRGTARPGRR